MCLATPDPADSGAFLRPHTAKNLHQAAATRAEMLKSPQEGELVVSWLRALPLWIEREGLRVVHAAWMSRAIYALTPFVDTRGALTIEGIFRAARIGDPVRSANIVVLGQRIPGRIEQVVEA